MFTFKKGQLNVEQIFEYLKMNDLNFSPPLSSRLDLEIFSAKLQKYAIHFYILNENRMIGFAACYFNDPEKRTGYISTVSICKEYQRLGLASKLLDLIKKQGYESGFEKISLRVRNNNLPGLALYTKSLFDVGKEFKKTNQTLMTFHLKKDIAWT